LQLDTSVLLTKACNPKLPFSQKHTEDVLALPSQLEMEESRMSKEEMEEE